MKKITSKLKNAFRTLMYRNYRLFFIGQGLSLIGTWMQQLALSWLVYRLTNSIFLLGVVGFSSQIMVFLFSPFAGAVADRIDRRKMIIITQILALIQALILSALVYTNLITVWLIMLLSIILGFIMSFDAPIRQSFMVDLIDHKKDLGNAIALNSSLFNGARLVGPFLAGLVIAKTGEGFCFLLNAASYFAVIIALLMMRITPKKHQKPKTKMTREIIDGFKYVYQCVPIRYVLLLLAFVSLIGMPPAVIMPAFAKDILLGGPQTLGYLMGASGFGALCGALYMASGKNVLNLGKIILISTLTFSFGLIFLSFAKVLWVALLVLMIIGFSFMLQMAASNTLLQTIVDDDKRGRVMSIYTMAFIGMAPFGSLVIGSAAHYWGIPFVLFIGGVLCFISAIIFGAFLPSFHKMVHPVYIKMGIMPELNKAINTVAELTSSEKE